MSPRAETAQVGRLLRQAAEWRMLALLFECPSADWRMKLAALSDQVENEELRRAAAQALAEGSEGLYHSVFGPGGPAPPREAAYHQSVQFGSLMSELAGYYTAFAYQPMNSEAADHIAVEVDFVAYLSLKQAYALEFADPERAMITAEAAQAFLADHVSAMAEPLAAALRDSGIHYLACASDLLLRRVGPPHRIGSTPDAIPQAQDS